MNENELKEAIANINNQILNAITKFPLSDEIQKLVTERYALREKCSHKFENGICVICGLEEHGRDDG